MLRSLLLTLIASTGGFGFTQPAHGSSHSSLATILVEAAPKQGFHHPYLLVLPETLSCGGPLIVALPTPPTSDDPADFLTAADRIARNATPVIGKLGVPLIVPALPRPPRPAPDGKSIINLYSPALSRAALLEREEGLARADLQVLAMVDHARANLQAQHSLSLDRRSILVGFSAAGHFATRMAILHPQRVAAVWAGGTGGHPILPIAEFEGKRLTYPVGIADLESVAGKSFDAASFSRIPIRIVQGGADKNSSLPAGNEPSDSYSPQQAQLVLDLLGHTASKRLAVVERVYRSVSSQTVVRVYPGVEHRLTPEMVQDMAEFMKEQIEACRVAKP